MQENFKILGVSENASKEEITSAYNALKLKYSKDRFLEGEAGNNAAKNLTKLENAYSEIMENFNNFSDNSNTESKNMEQVESFLKDGKLEDAQKCLDNIALRNAEWHYLQSVIFYKKTWFNESKKQLEIAMEMDSHNSKYSDAYAKLNQKMEFTNNQFHSGNNFQNNSENGQRQNRQMGGEGASDCLSFCATWCCFNLLCNMCCR